MFIIDMKARAYFNLFLLNTIPSACVKEDTETICHKMSTADQQAVVLAEYLEQHQQIVSGKRIIELGAGTGLVGMVAALLGGDVTITERGTVLEHLTSIVNENFDKQDLLQINVAELDWTKLLPTSDTYDVILGADIVYIEEVFPDLLQKFIDLSNCETTILLSCKIRYDRDTRYISMMETAFKVQEIFYDTPRDIKIYKASKIC